LNILGSGTNEKAQATTAVFSLLASSGTIGSCPVTSFHFSNASLK